MSARDRILARLRAHAPDRAPELPDVAGWQTAHAAPAQSTDTLTELFCRQITLAHAEVHRVSNGSWLQKLWEVVMARQVRQLLVGHETPHGAKVMEELPASGVACRAYDQAIEGWKDSLFHHVDASLTTARSAIAETGTLILWPNRHEPRLMSLVPPLHIVLLDAANIHPDFHTAMQREGWGREHLPTNALLISGPSKTADIQQTLAYGAHGPRELVVLVKEALA